MIYTGCSILTVFFNHTFIFLLISQMQKVNDFYESIYREVWLGGFNNFQSSIFKFLKEHENRAQLARIAGMSCGAVLE